MIEVGWKKCNSVMVIFWHEISIQRCQVLIFIYVVFFNTGASSSYEGPDI